MFAKGRKKGTVRFCLTHANGSHKVKLCGDFTNWEPLTMRKQKNDSYAVTLPLAPGTYQYKFQVDGQWLLDPDNQYNAVNSFGSLNSVAQVNP